MLGEVDAVILARATEPSEVTFVHTFLAGQGLNISDLAELPRGLFILTSRSSSGRWSTVRFTATPRATPHVRHLRKYADTTLRPDHAFVFRAPDGPPVATADSLEKFRRTAGTVDDQVLANHAERHDFSRWIRDVFSDAELAAQLAKAERRWGAGETSDLRQAIDGLIAARYWSEER